MLDRLSNLDRRWVFLAMALAVGVPILLQFRVPESASKMTRQAFDVFESLPPGSRVLIVLDYDPAGMAELHPMSAALTRHAALKGHKIYFMTLWPTGTAFIDDMEYILRTEYPDLKYGEDYVDLGFRAGNEGVIKVITGDLRRSFGTDVRNVSLADMPMTHDIENIREMDLIVDISGGTPGTKEWVQYASTPFGIPTIAGVTGVQTPMFIPYLPGQLQGMLGSIKAAAEYESLLLEKYPEIAGETPPTADGEPAATAIQRPVREAQRRMGPQLVAHLLMIGLIIAGNVLYFLSRKSRTA
ncbi:MAG: hypothetical protein WBC44_05670 [Planctomycetaceae bacterium]